MNTDDEARCDTCVYSDSGFSGDGHLRCHRYPPTRAIPGYGYRGEHIAVSPNDWCGEWEPEEQGVEG